MFFKLEVEMAVVLQAARLGRSLPSHGLEVREAPFPESKRQTLVLCVAGMDNDESIGRGGVVNGNGILVATREATSRGPPTSRLISGIRKAIVHCDVSTQRLFRR